MFELVVFFIGVLAGCFFMEGVREIVVWINAGNCWFRIGSYKIGIYSDSVTPNPYIPVVKLVVDPVKSEVCETCGGEDMYFSGTKHILPCPKCKKNSRKSV